MSGKKFNIVSEYEKVIDVNKDIRDYLSNEKVDESVCNAVEICLTEALNNVIKHAYKGDHSQQIEILINLSDNVLEIVLIDSGMPREKIKEPTLDFDPEDIENLPESGMGLYIIHQLMDTVEYHSNNGKNFFTLKKHLN